MNAKDYLSGVYLDDHKFSKEDTIKLMEDYYNYRVEYERQMPQPLILCHVGDFVKEAGGDWIKVIKVEGRNIYLDYDDGNNCLNVDDVIAWMYNVL